MKKILLTVYGLAIYHPQRNNYVLMLGELNSPIRLPIFIGFFEAQSIALAMEGYKTSRPLTHELFINFAREFDIEFIEVIIHKLEDNIFHALLICRRDDQIKEIDARTSDAVALALHTGIPIYTYQHILDEAGINIEIMEKELQKQEDTESEEQPEKRQSPRQKTKSTSSFDKESFVEFLKNLSTGALKELLQESIEKEEYEKASLIRDELNKRKKQ